MDKFTIKTPNKAERETLIVALVNSGYTVCMNEVKDPDYAKKKMQLIVAWKEENGVKEKQNER